MAWAIGAVVMSGCGTVDGDQYGPSSLVSISASGAVMGQPGLIRVTFSNPVGSDTDVALSSASATTATVPGHVTVSAGAVSGDVAYAALSPGIAVFHATAGDATQSTTATVVDMLRVNPSGGTTFEVGARGILSQQVNIIVPDSIKVSLTSSQRSVVTVDNELTIPEFQSSGLAQITAVSPGAAVITGSYGGQQATRTITVIDKARIVDIFGTSLFEVGGHGTAQVSLNARLANATSLTVTPSDPSVVSVPRSYLIPAGSNFASFDVQGMAVGSTNLVFSLNGSSATLPIVVLAKAQLQNVFLDGTPSVGDSSQLSLSMNAVAASSHDIVLTSSDPSVVTVPTVATVFAGTSSSSVSITPLKAGRAIITATFNGISRQLDLEVGTSGYSLNLYGQDRYVIGTIGQLSIQIGTSVPGTVSLVSSDPSIVSVPSSLIVRFSDVAPLTMLRAGSVTITATANGATATFPLSVVATTGIRQFGPSFTVPVNGSINGSLSLDAQAPLGTVITFSTSDASVAPAPDPISVTNGLSFVQVGIRGGNTGTATVTATVGTTRVSALVYVGGSSGGGNFQGLFAQGSSTLELGAAVPLTAQFFPPPQNDDTGTITFGTPGILTTPQPTVAISSTNCCSSFPVIAAVAGSSDVTLTVSGVAQTTRLDVVSAATFALNLPGAVKVGSSVAARLTANAVLAADRTAVLTSSNPNVAAVALSSATIGPGTNSQQTTFGVRGVAAGTAVITARIRGTDYTASITVAP